MLSPERIQRLSQTFCRTCCTVGIARLCEWYRSRRGVTVLRLQLTPRARDDAREVWTPETLRIALGVLARYYRVIPLDEAVAALRKERPLPPSSVVLVTTLSMRPEPTDLSKLLASFGLHCTIYVAPGLLERGLPPWPVLIRAALKRAPGDTVQMYGRQWLLAGSEYRRAALEGITSRLYALPEADRTTRAEELVESWGIQPDTVPGLKWYEVEGLARSEFITVGAAGFTGDSLVRLPLDRAVYEIHESRALLEDRLNLPVRHFEYPWDDISVAVRDQVVRAGYVSALLGGSRSNGMNSPDTDPYAVSAHSLRAGTPENVRVNLAGIAEFAPPLKRRVA